MTPRRRWCTTSDESAAITAHRLLSSYAAQQWRHRLALILSLHELRGLPQRRLPPTVPSSLTFSSVSWRQNLIWPKYESLRCLMVDSKRSWRPARILIDLLPYIFVCFMLSVWYAKHSSVAFVFKSLDSPLHIRCQRPALTTEQYWQDKTCRENCRKTLYENWWRCFLIELLRVLAPVWSLLLMFRLRLAWILGICHFF